MMKEGHGLTFIVQTSYSLFPNYWLYQATNDLPYRSNLIMGYLKGGIFCMLLAKYIHLKKSHVLIILISMA